MNNYFNVNYEMDRDKVHGAISDAVRQGRVDYVCVADGVVLNMANRDAEYMRAVNGGMFVICDSSYVPLYLRWILQSCSHCANRCSLRWRGQRRK